MSKANEPAYPLHFVNEQEAIDYKGNPNGLTKREKLAMEIYVKECGGINIAEPDRLKVAAEQSLRAADIFFDELNK